MAASKSRGGREATVRKMATCNKCGHKFRIPEGWNVGAANRRHYWAKHREVMLRSKGSGK